MTIQQATKNWRTTAAGIVAILAAVANAANALLDGNPATVPDWGVVIAAVTAGIGLLSARDATVTSRAMGIE